MTPPDGSRGTTAYGSTGGGSHATATGSSYGGAGTVGEQTLGRAARAAAALTIADAVRLLSRPGGLAARLRGQLTGPAGTPSLPLDVGTATDTIPVQIRRAVTRRDGQCRFPGCDAPPVRCHVHHLRPRAAGGGTSVVNCLLLCAFHHLAAVHRWGWQLILNPDDTTTATSPDRLRVLHSHAPPTAARPRLRRRIAQASPGAAIQGAPLSSSSARLPVLFRP